MNLLYWTWTRVFLVIVGYWIIAIAAGLVLARIRGRRQQPTYVGRISDTEYLLEYEGSLHLGPVALVLLGPPFVVVLLRLILGS